MVQKKKKRKRKKESNIKVREDGEEIHIYIYIYYSAISSILASVVSHYPDYHRFYFTTNDQLGRP